MARLLEFNVQSLEDRQLLAGTVSVTLNPSGDLRIVGDAEDNRIRVLHEDSDTLRVAADAGTSINDMQPNEDLLIDYDELRDLRVTMKGGHDRFASDSLLEFRHAVILGGGGNEEVWVFSSFSGNVRVNLGGGEPGMATWVFSDQHVLLSGFFSADGNLTVQSSNTDDRIILAPAASTSEIVGGRLRLNAGGGDDEIHIDDVDFGDEHIDVGASIRINSGAGDDEVFIGGVDVVGSTRINLGAGDDLIEIDEFASSSTLWVQGAAGFDTLEEFSGTTSQLFPRILGFEDFPE